MLSEFRNYYKTIWGFKRYNNIDGYYKEMTNIERLNISKIKKEVVLNNYTKERLENVNIDTNFLENELQRKIIIKTNAFFTKHNRWIAPYNQKVVSYNNWLGKIKEDGLWILDLYVTPKEHKEWEKNNKFYWETYSQFLYVNWEEFIIDKLILQKKYWETPVNNAIFYLEMNEIYQNFKNNTITQSLKLKEIDKDNLEFLTEEIKKSKEEIRKYKENLELEEQKIQSTDNEKVKEKFTEEYIKPIKFLLENEKDNLEFLTEELNYQYIQSGIDKTDIENGNLEKMQNTLKELNNYKSEIELLDIKEINNHSHHLTNEMIEENIFILNKLKYIQQELNYFSNGLNYEEKLNMIKDRNKIYQTLILEDGLDFQKFENYMNTNTLL